MLATLTLITVVSQWTLVMAATTVAIVPLIALFLAAQRHIVASIVVSGLK